MERDQRDRGSAQRMGPPAEGTDPCRLPEQCLCGRRAEAHDELWPDGCELELEPMAAGRDLRPVRLVVDAPLPDRTPLEVLHRIRHVCRLDCDSGVTQQLAEEKAGWTDEGAAGSILDVPGLLTHEHQSARVALAEHRLGRTLEERAARACRGVRPEDAELGLRGRHRATDGGVVRLRPLSPARL